MSRIALRLFLLLHITLYRLSRGRVMGTVRNLPILLLTTEGRRSGKKRTVPVGYSRDGDAYLVVASAAGAPHHPAWYLNAREAGVVTVEVRGDRFTATAEAQPDGPERDAYYAQFKIMSDAFDSYEKKTDRVFPILVLHPQTDGEAPPPAKDA